MENNFLSPKEIVNYVESVGIDKASKKSIQTLLLGILAGMFIALGAFAAGVASHSIENYGVSKLVAGAVFPVGLILVLICGAELFTGNTLLSSAWFEKKISFKAIMKNWSIVYVGNFIGAIAIVFMLVYSGALDTNSGLFGAYAVKTATKKVSLTFGQAFLSGILCNILVSIAVWGSYAAKDIIGKIWITVIPIMAFIISGFEHSIANMYYLFMGLAAKTNPAFVEGSHMTAEQLANLDISGIVQNLIPVTMGNIIGGALVVAGVYWIIFRKAYTIKSNKNIEG